MSVTIRQAVLHLIGMLGDAEHAVTDFFRIARSTRVSLAHDEMGPPASLFDGNGPVRNDGVQYLEKKFACPVAFFSGDIGGMMTSLDLEVRDAAGNKLPENSLEKTERYGENVD